MAKVLVSLLAIALLSMAPVPYGEYRDVNREIWRALDEFRSANPYSAAVMRWADTQPITYDWRPECTCQPYRAEASTFFYEDHIRILLFEHDAPAWPYEKVRYLVAHELGHVVVAYWKGHQPDPYDHLWVSEVVLAMSDGWENAAFDQGYDPRERFAFWQDQFDHAQRGH